MRWFLIATAVSKGRREVLPKLKARGYHSRSNPPAGAQCFSVTLRNLLRAWARRRKPVSLAVLTLPLLSVLAFDVARRGPQLARFGALDLARYALAAVNSAMLWGALLVLASRKRGATGALSSVAFVLLTTCVFGAQQYFFAQFATYLNIDAIHFGAGFLSMIISLVLADLPALMRAHLPAFCASLMLLAAGRWLLRPRTSELRVARWAVFIATLLALSLPWSYRTLQAATPDMICLHALGDLARQGITDEPPDEQMALPGARSPEFIPALPARPGAPRNVLFVLTESVRADAVCSAFDQDCTSTSFSNAIVPHRTVLKQMRANDSTTAISVGVLFSGLSPSASRDELHHAPLAWEYARAAGWDTAYWTSQDLRFGNSELFVRDMGARLRTDGLSLDPECTFSLGGDDRKLSSHVAMQLGALKEPFFAVAHYANTHFPYRVEDDKVAFLPATYTKDPARRDEFFNYYKNAIRTQDAAIAELLSAVKQSPLADRTLIVFTSDHGEAFREHSQIGHTVSIFDEEVHVPFWIDAPDGALSPEERQQLDALSETPVFHADVLPTVLDLMGVWQAPELARFRAKMLGSSLLRPLDPARAMPLSNCSALWGCAFKNWGMMRGPLKLEARQWDPDWHCWDVLADPLEQHELGAKACGSLADEAISLFGTRPGGN